MKNTKVGYLYRDQEKKRRHYAIFATGFDRFILVDKTDPWMILQTAEILSSKLPTMAYVLHSISFDFNSDNCLEFTISNKTNQTTMGTSIVTHRQNPMLKFLQYDTNHISKVGWNPDYDTPEGRDILRKLQEYAQFVLDVVYVLNFTDAMHNPFNGMGFMDKYISDDMMNTAEGPMRNSYDRSTTKKGALFEIRHILYTSETIEEAEAKIKETWINHRYEQEIVMTAFYRLWGRELPPELAGHTTMKPVNITPLIL